VSVRFLFVTPYLPSPPRSGGMWRMHGLMSALARSHSVSVLSYPNPDLEHSQQVQAAGQYCDEVRLVENSLLRHSRRRKRWLQLSSLSRKSSVDKLTYHQPAFQAALDRLLSQREFDVACVETAQMGYFRFPSGPARILDEQNIEYDILARTAEAERHPLRKLYSHLNASKLRREEQAMWRRFDGCAAVSERDASIIRSVAPATPTAVVPNGVDTTFFQSRAQGQNPVSDSNNSLVFVGVNYYPNIQGIRVFLSEVMPRLRDRFDGLRLFIVGNFPEQLRSEWAGPDVTPTGFVDDLRPYLERARAVVVPLYIGGGTRLKILEAMAMQRAIVSTTIGAEGIDATHEENILLADTAEDFAQQVGRLLNDGDLAQHLGRNARRLVESKYDWRTSARTLEEFSLSLLERGRHDRG
jgi:polysaccharide biosynthesis protein PslH